MKIGTDRNPKFQHLVELLRCSRPMTVGILELLWHATAEFAPQGDIGRFDNRGIAKLVGWKGNPDALVDALTACRWLDACAERRLLVHDWKDHAPEFLRKRLERGKLTFFRANTPTADNGGQVCLPSLTQPCLTKPYQEREDTAFLSLFFGKTAQPTARQAANLTTAISTALARGVPSAYIRDQLPKVHEDGPPGKSVDRIARNWRELPDHAKDKYRKEKP